MVIMHGYVENELVADREHLVDSSHRSQAAALDFVLDMVHHNPGEPLFDSKFCDPRWLGEFGYNGQVLKHFNALVRFDAIAPGIFPATSEEETWLREFTAAREREMRMAKEAGLMLFGHIDLVILPKRIVEAMGEEIRDPQTGKISFAREATRDLHRAVFDELFGRFPEIDGFVVRVGETYLFDTPHHIGNAACGYRPGKPTDEEKKAFVDLLNFLREEVCEKHNKRVIYRTWDTWRDRFHSNPEYYLDVTGQVAPHENLLFAIKHSQADFHRWMPFNPSLGIGEHRQIVEVQCQREYEGKGAFPCYIARCVIEGFPEMSQPMGLRDVIASPLIVGLWTWSRGGGWFGPYLKSEFWPELNAAVLQAFAAEPSRTEEELFHDAATRHFALSEDDAELLRRMALASETAVLKGKCCAAWDRKKPATDNPCNSWFRDDRLGGEGKLDVVLERLAGEGGLEEALTEKAEAVREWRYIRKLAASFSEGMPAELRKDLVASAEYGLRLFTWIEAAWKAAALRWMPGIREEERKQIFEEYDMARHHYNALPEDEPASASLFRDVYWSWPGEPEKPGLGALVEDVRRDVMY